MTPLKIVKASRLVANPVRKGFRLHEKNLSNLCSYNGRLGMSLDNYLELSSHRLKGQKFIRLVNLGMMALVGLVLNFRKVDIVGHFCKELHRLKLGYQ